MAARFADGRHGPTTKEDSPTDLQGAAGWTSDRFVLPLHDVLASSGHIHAYH